LSICPARRRLSRQIIRTCSPYMLKRQARKRLPLRTLNRYEKSFPPSAPLGKLLDCRLLCRPGGYGSSKVFGRWCGGETFSRPVRRTARDSAEGDSAEGLRRGTPPKRLRPPREGGRLRPSREGGWQARRFLPGNGGEVFSKKPCVVAPSHGLRRSTAPCLRSVCWSSITFICRGRMFLSAAMAAAVPAAWPVAIRHAAELSDS